jgi:hypothetical protein
VAKEVPVFLSQTDEGPHDLNIDLSKDLGDVRAELA